MRLPILYNVRHLLARKGSNALTAVGIALVSWVFIFTLALAGGFEAALKTTGSPLNAIILRSGSTGEVTSIVSREAAQVAATQPDVATAADGSPLAAPELVVIWSLIRTSGGPTNVTVRGVGGKSMTLRPGVRIVAGRMFRPGLDEIVVGARIADRFRACSVGDRLKLAGRAWTVVGVFDAGGSSFDSEIWGDVELFMPAFDRPVFQSVLVRLSDPTHLEPLKKRLEADPRFSLQVRRQDEFYAAQSGMLGGLMRGLGLFVTLIMALGAVSGALNTMYAAVGSRTKEIGTLLAIGFPRGAVLLSILIESVLLCVVGGAVGCLMALPVSSFTTGTMSFANFSELAFRFQVTPGMLLAGVLFAAGMGLVGGFFPARKAASLPIIEALREA